MILETKNLLLKTVEMQDAESLHENYWKDIISSYNMLWKPTQKVEDAQKNLEYMLETTGSHLFTIIKRENQQLIGFLSVTQDEDDPKVIRNIGFGFASAEAHKGYGNEVLYNALEFCFNTLEANEVNISYLKAVGISHNIVDLFGFLPSDMGETQIRRKHTGEILDVVNMTTTRELWQTNRLKFS